MADNVQLSAAVGTGAVARAKDRAGVETTIVAIDLNPAGSETLMAGSMPVSGTFWQTTQPVSVASLPLPGGAATSANQATEISALAAIIAALGGTLAVGGTVAVTGTFWQATQPVSAASLPLPTGAATDAKQDTGNTSLANLDGNLGAKADSAASTDTGTFSLIALFKRLLQGITTLSGVVTSSRAATSPIAGQAGVAANSGIIGATTQRMTLATNDPAVVSLASVANAFFPGTSTTSISVADSGTSSTTNGVGQTVTTGTPTASSSSTYTLAGAPTVILQIAGTMNLTLAFERSIDGVTFTALAMEEIGLGGTVASSLAINENSTTFLRASVAGFSSVRVRCTARTTGTALITWQAGGGDAHTSSNLAQVGGAAVAKGHGTASTALRVELPTDGTGTVGLNAGSNLIGKVSLKDISDGDYETVAASATDQALGATGAAGDYLAGLLIVPASTSPGAVSIKDGSGSSITVFTGGASSVSNLVPFFVPLGIISGSGAWKITTGANVSAIGVGNFT